MLPGFQPLLKTTMYRFVLEPYKGMATRFQCPSCQSIEKTFSRYLDTDTGEHLHPTVGRCNRESNCSYHYTPRQYFRDNNILFSPPYGQVTGRDSAPSVSYPISFIPDGLLRRSLTGYATNHLAMFLHRMFGTIITNELISKYFIGSSNHWNGATVFWQID